MEMLAKKWIGLEGSGCAAEQGILNWLSGIFQLLSVKNIIGKTWGVTLPADSDSQLALQHFLVVECKVVEKNKIGKTLGYQTPKEYNQQILNPQLALWHLVVVECKVFERENLGHQTPRKYLYSVIKMCINKTK